MNNIMTDKNAKYTEFFSQWVTDNGGAETAFPALFYKVPDVVTDGITVKFYEAFLLEFCTREIGFETEALFALKFEGRAQRVLPAYIKVLNDLATVKPEDTAGAITSEFEYPETGSDSVVASPSALRRQTTNVTEESAIEQSDTFENLARRQRDIWQDIFREFDSIFMQIY